VKKLAILLSAAMVAACGGGGGGGGGDAPAASGNNAASNPPLELSGVVATGAPLANARVDIKCAAGLGNAAADASGAYRASIEGGQLPCVAKATGPDGTVLYSATLQAGVFNVTPLTQLMVANLASEAPQTFYEAFNALRASRISSEAIKQAQSNVRNYLPDVDTSAVPDFVTARFAADGKDPMDAALDNLGRKVSKSTLALIQDTLASVYVDTVAPTATLTADKTTVNEAAGSVVLTVAATDNLGIAKVEFLEDGVVVETVKTRPFVSTRSYAADKNGIHSFAARAFDTASNMVTSNQVAVDVRIVTAPPPDTTPPVAVINVASSRVSAAGAFMVQATATDDVGVAKVEFYRDGVLLNTDSTAPFEYADTLTRAIYGNVIYAAKAYDAAGNTSASASKSVLVNIIPSASETPTGTLSADRETIDSSLQILNLNLTGAAGAGIATTEIREGSTVLQTCASATCSAAVSFNALGQNGTHVYGFVVCDIYTLCRHEENTVKVVVKLPSAQFDKTAPVIFGLTPSTSTVTAAQAVTLSAQVSDGESGVSKIEFYEVGTPAPIATVLSFPYQTSVSYKSSDNGSHQYFIKVYDSALTSSGDAAPNVSDNQATPARVTVSIPAS